MLNNVVDVNNYILNKLSSICKNLKIVSAFPSQISEFPIKKPIASVGVVKATIPIANCIVEGTNTAGKVRYGTTADFELSLKICVPKTMSGLECYRAFDEVADACLRLDEVWVTKVYCEDIKYNRNMGALVLTAGITLKAELEDTTN